jgi:hypothetical protein
MSDSPSSTPKESHLAETIVLGRRWHLTAGAEAAVKALGARLDMDVKREAGNALRHIGEFLSDISPSPTLDVREADFARAAHTYLRKYCDDSLTTLLYRLIADGKGWAVWAAFVKGAVANNLDYHEAQRDAETYYHDNIDIPENCYMRCALGAWPKKDYDQMIKYFRKDGWFDWLPKNGVSKTPLAKSER